MTEESTTPESTRKKQKHDLAVALAAGRRVSKWAEENDVAKRTAYRWAAEPETKKSIDKLRRQFVDRAVGRLARCATSAASKITKLAETASSESVKLSACRAILSDMMSISEYSSLEHRMNELEEQLRGRTGHPDRTG
jgi:hypothetical protein